MSTTNRSTDAILLLVVGAGRSGTSTAAGSLSRLGFVVPAPEVPADETNPRGFFEPQWVVDFHKRVFGEIRIRTNDPRPVAMELAAEASARDDLRAEVLGWLQPQAGDPRLVVKDPRTFWMHDLWRHAGAAAGRELAFLSMLRPPAEVARSRDQHYLVAKDEELRRARETTSVAGWCHANLVTEAATRQDRRAFVLYHDLMGDWRGALRRADDQLGLGITAGVTDERHDIDDFIDVNLNRSQSSWDDFSVHPELTGIADDIWSAMSRLVEDPADAAAMAEMDDLRGRYDRLYGLAEDLTLEQKKLDREGSERELRRVRRRNAELAAQLEQAKRSPTNRVIARLRRR